MDDMVNNCFGRVSNLITFNTRLPLDAEVFGYPPLIIANTQVDNCARGKGLKRNAEVRTNRIVLRYPVLTVGHTHPVPVGSNAHRVANHTYALCCLLLTPLSCLHGKADIKILFVFAYPRTFER